MPIIELAPVSLREVEAEIRAMEETYFSSHEFLTNAERAAQVPEDEAQEWHYLLMQQKALKAHVPHRHYSTMNQGREYAPVDEQRTQLEVAA
jgi:hypothetical protein